MRVTLRKESRARAAQKGAVPQAPAESREEVTEVRFPAVVISGGLFRRRHPVVVHQLNGRQAWVRSSSEIRAGRSVRVRFKIPSALSESYAGLTCDLPAKVMRCQVRDGGHELALRFSRRLDRLVKGVILRHWLRVGVCLAPILVAMAYLRWTTASYFWYDPVVYFYSLGVGAFFLSRFIVSACHRAPKLNPAYEPTLSVVMAVRNEEAVIAQAVESCFTAEYPAHKREVIVVNDGSTDRTPQVLEGLARKFPGLRVYSLPPSGKRHGMAKGVREARGELVVFVDSDTILHPKALRNITAGFDDPGLGAVSGYCSALNSGKNLLTQMTDVRYFLSFELMKAAEAAFGCVTCCPGVLSAYRRAYLARILDTWLNQSFLGAPATFGDDRSLTNFILRDYRVDYNPSATCTTMVPETWLQYLHQQVRWKKSWARETLIASTFMYKKNPLAAISFYISTLCSLLSPLMVFRAVYLEYTEPYFPVMHYVLGLLLMALSMGLYTLLRRPALKWLTGTAFVATQLFIHGPQTYYAILTVRKNHWGTR